MNRDRKIFYCLHAAAKPFLFISGYVIGVYGWLPGLAVVTLAWAIDLSSDFFYWRNFDRSKAVCFTCGKGMVCPDCGGMKARI